MRGYVSARARAQLVDVLLSAQIAILSLRVVGALYLALGFEGDLALTMRRGERLSAPFLLVLFIGTAIAFLFWLDRAARNLPALGAREPIAPEHVVGVFFAICVNVFAIPYVVRHVWRASDPTPPARGWLLYGWWPALLGGGLTLTVPLVSAPLLLVSAACLVGIVRDVQRRQDEQFLDDERRRAVPGPTADALR
jgi:cytochrome bd-type quinol oxidase subunit 2